VNTLISKLFNINTIGASLIRWSCELLRTWIGQHREYPLPENSSECLMLRTPDAAEMLVSEMRTLMTWLRYDSPAEWPRVESREAKDGQVSVQLKKAQMISIAELPDGRPFPARVVDISGKTLRFIAHRELSPGTCIRAVCQGILLLGEVSFCQRSSGDVRIKVNIEHALFGIPEIADNCRRLLKATAGTNGRS
jgi:hypothetical protein